jgi:hypothetical protein
LEVVMTGYGGTGAMKLEEFLNDLIETIHERHGVPPDLVVSIVSRVCVKVLAGEPYAVDAECSEVHKYEDGRWI